MIVGRVKGRTALGATCESGLLKMPAIGAAKYQAAMACRGDGCVDRIRCPGRAINTRHQVNNMSGTDMEKQTRMPRWC